MSSILDPKPSDKHQHESLCSVRRLTAAESAGRFDVTESTSVIHNRHSLPTEMSITFCADTLFKGMTDGDDKEGFFFCVS
jgi:hypothetical protein